MCPLKLLLRTAGYQATCVGCNEYGLPHLHMLISICTVWVINLANESIAGGSSHLVILCHKVQSIEPTVNPEQ